MLITWRYILLTIFFCLKIAFSTLAGEITIPGYTSTSKAYEALNTTIAKKLIESINYVTTFADDSTGIMSRTGPDVILFFQLLHSVMKDNMILTNVIIDVSKDFNDYKRRKTLNARTKEDYRRWLEIFNFPKDDVYNFVKKIARVNLSVPSVMAEQIFLLDNKHKIINRCFVENDDETLNWFLDSGYSVKNILFEDLEAAFHKGNINILKHIFKHKYFKQSEKQLSVDSRYIDNKSFLHLAVQFAEIDEILALLKYSKNNNIRDSSGATPIYRAVETNRVEVVQKLIEHNADTNLKYGDEENYLLHLAAQLGYVDILLALLVKGDPNVKNKNGDTPIHFVAKNFSMNVFYKLSNTGANINGKNNFGETPLHIAALFGDIDAVQTLINQAANVNEKDDEGLTPIMKAVLKKNVEVIKLFLKRNSGLLNTKTELENSIMHLAVETGDVKFVQWLLAIGASVNDKNNLLQIPLYLAALKGDTNIINVLKEKTNLQSNNSGLNMLHEAALSGNSKAVKALLNVGIDVNSRGLWSMTALHYASGQGHTNIVTILLQNKANINIKSITLLTPLHYAVIGRKLEVVKMLVKACAKLDAKDNDERTPLDIAEENSLKAIESFLQRSPKHCQS